MNNLCSCGRIHIGMQVLSNRNWNPDCPKHGEKSKWWNAPEQVAARKKKSEVMRELIRERNQAVKKEAE